MLLPDETYEQCIHEYSQKQSIQNPNIFQDLKIFQDFKQKPIAQNFDVIENFRNKETLFEDFPKSKNLVDIQKSSIIKESIEENRVQVPSIDNLNTQMPQKSSIITNNLSLENKIHEKDGVSQILPRKRLRVRIKEEILVHQKNVLGESNVDSIKEEEETPNGKNNIIRNRFSEHEEGEAGARADGALRALRACDDFLHEHGIRPEFFCRYREKMLLQETLQAGSLDQEGAGKRVRARQFTVQGGVVKNGDEQEGAVQAGVVRGAAARIHMRRRLRVKGTIGDASSSNEAVHLQQRLRSLSTELVTLRNRLHVGAALAGGGGAPPQARHPAPLPQVGSPPAPILGPPLPAGQPAVPPRAPPHAVPPGSGPGPAPFITAPAPPTDTFHTEPHGAVGSIGAGGRWRGEPAHTPPSVAVVDIDDLIQLPGPLTEDAVLKCLHARFLDNHFYTNVGGIVVALNSYADAGRPLTLREARAAGAQPALARVVHDAVRQQADTGYPQAIILSGSSGSGKTYASMLLLRRLFEVAGGGAETDAFKHLAAAFSVLRSLGSARTATNSDSSRIGQFIEVQVTDGALYRTKIHCYFLDQTRVIHPLQNERNYHIFYQMLAGLTHEERVALHLDGYTPLKLRYLQRGDTRQNEAEDGARFRNWKVCLGILGIPYLDVVKVLAAVLLLGNIHFSDGQSLEVDVKGETELNAVANLLGIPGAALLRGLTTRTHNARGQLVKSVCDANMSNMTRDSLAKALYCRTVATIVRRANSLKRLGSTLGTLSSDSNESVHNQAEVMSQHASTIGGTNAGSKSMAALNNAVRHATDGFIGILDMFGFEDPKPSQLEHLCINLCAETMQHFYNTHIFKSSIESCREEGIQCDLEVDYVDNVPCIDLISSLRTGLLSMLDVECSIRGTAESYISKMKVQHKANNRLFEPKPLEPRLFGIQHFAGRVVYDASDFLDTNKDVVPDDLVSVFYKYTCTFGFATHLFGSELKALYSCEKVPRGVSFRISPTSHTDLLNGDEPVSTLTQDFHTRLDNLLRTLVHARPHFVRCIKSNPTETPMRFDRATVVRQIRSLQVLETVNLMAGGYPHRMRFKAFNARYRALAPFAQLRRIEEKATEDCRLILQLASARAPPDVSSVASTSFALGKRHIFLSEGMRQRLERLRSETRRAAAERMQRTWRAWRERRVASGRRLAGGGNVGSAGAGGGTQTLPRPRPAPIAGTPPPDPADKCHNIVQQTCTLFGLDLERPPPVPPSRPYTVAGSVKLGYPQTRLMKMNFPECDGPGEGAGVVLRAGEAVVVVGASPRRGHLLVEHHNSANALHVPFQYLELLKPPPPPAPPHAHATLPNAPLNI